MIDTAPVLIPLKRRSTAEVGRLDEKAICTWNISTIHGWMSGAGKLATR